MIESYEVLNAAFEKKGIKFVASELRLSQPLLYKWCERPNTDEDIMASGASNPLDRIRKIYEVTKDEQIIQWVCQIANGYFVRNVETEKKKNMVQDMHRLIKEFSDLLEAATMSASDKKITKEEAKKIRKEWEELKTIGESIAVACEKQNYEIL